MYQDLEIIYMMYLLILPELGPDDELVLIDEELREVQLWAVRCQSHAPPHILLYCCSGQDRSVDPCIVKDKESVVFCKLRRVSLSLAQVSYEVVRILRISRCREGDQSGGGAAGDASDGSLPRLCLVLALLAPRHKAAFPDVVNPA